MNLLATADALKNLSDSQLRSAYTAGSVPQFLALTELQRRQSMRSEYERRDPSAAAETSIADKLLTGIGELPTSGQIAANLSLSQSGPPGSPGADQNVAPGAPPPNSGGDAGVPMPSGPGGFTRQAPANPGGVAQGFAMGAKKFAAGGRVGMASGGDARPWMRAPWDTAIPPDEEFLPITPGEASRPQGGILYFRQPPASAPARARPYRGPAVPSSDYNPQAAIFQGAEERLPTESFDTRAVPASRVARSAPPYSGAGDALPLPDSIGRAQAVNPAMLYTEAPNLPHAYGGPAPVPSRPTMDYLREAWRAANVPGTPTEGGVPYAYGGAAPRAASPAPSPAVRASIVLPDLTPDQLRIREGIDALPERNYDRNELARDQTYATPSDARPAAGAAPAPGRLGANVRGDGLARPGSGAPSVGGASGGGSGPGGGGVSSLGEYLRQARGELPDRYAESDRDLAEQRAELARAKGQSTDNALMRMGAAMMEGGAKSGDFLGITGLGINAGLTDMERARAEQGRLRAALAQASIAQATGRQHGDTAALTTATQLSNTDKTTAAQLEAARIHAGASAASAAAHLEGVKMQLARDPAMAAAINQARLRRGEGAQPTDAEYSEMLTLMNPRYSTGMAAQETRALAIQAQLAPRIEAALLKDTVYASMPDGPARERYAQSYRARAFAEAGLPTVTQREFDIRDKKD